MKTEEIITQTKWSIDPSHSEIGFKVKHLMITNVKGSFKNFEATVNTSGEEFITSEVEVSIDPASINTNDEKRDEHLKSGDFLDVDNHKKITFKGKSVERVDKIRSYVLHGDLTMKGITNEVALDVEYAGMMKDPWGNEKTGFTVTGKINRKDWGLNWNSALETGGILVGDEVFINCEVQLIKQNSAI